MEGKPLSVPAATVSMLQDAAQEAVARY